MPLSSDSGEQLLQRARSLWEAREDAVLVAELGDVEREELVAEPFLGFYLAEAWYRLGERKQALDLLRELAPVCVRRGNDRLSRQRLNLEGVLLFGAGDVAGAQDAWTRLLSSATRAGDGEFIARANNNFGVVYTLQGDWERALVSYGRATAAYQRLGYLRGLAQSHNNQAITYREMDFLSEADHHFQQAIAYSREDGSSEDELLRARIERSLLLCYRGDLPLAEATARRVVTLGERAGDALHIGEAYRVLGMIALAGGRWTVAREHADRALSTARDEAAALLEAESCEILLAVQPHLGEELDPVPLAERSEQLFAAMGARSWGLLLRQRLTQLTSRQGETTGNSS